MTLTASSLADAVRQIQENQTYIAETEQLLQDLLLRSTSLLQSQRLLEQQAVIATLSSVGHQLGCHEGRPVAALLTHRCLLHWKSFEAGPEGAALLDQLLTVIAAQGTEEEQQQQQQGDDDGEEGEQQQGSALPGLERAAYWLASVSTLLALVTKLAPLYAPHPSAHPPTHHPDPAASSALSKISEIQRKLSNTFRAGWTKGLFSKPNPKPDELGHEGAAGEDLTAHPAPESSGQAPGHPPPPHHPHQQQAVPAAVPVDAFRRQLSLLTLRLYGVLRDLFKKPLAGLLPACVQRPSGLGSPLGSPAATSPRTPHQLLLPQGSCPEAGPDSPPPSAQQGLGAASALRPWADLVLLLSQGLLVLQQQGVPHIIIKCLLKQVLGFVDVQMFNQLLLRPECCSSSNALYMSEGLSQLDAWLAGQGAHRETAYLAPLRTSMRHTRQALTFLVHPDKGGLTLEDITRVCSSLSLQQLYRLCTTFWDDLPPPLAALPLLPPSQLPPLTPGAHPAPAAAGEATELPEGQGQEGAAAVEPAGGDVPGGREGEEAAAAEQSPGGPPEIEAAPAGLLVSAASGSPEGMGMVSGEVLEELKRESQVQSNGGLIVTFLLDEDQQQIIAARSAGAGANPPASAAPCGVAPEVLALIDDTLQAPAPTAPAEEGGQRRAPGALYLGMPVPPQLLSAATPREPFLFLEKDVSIM